MEHPSVRDGPKPRPFPPNKIVKGRDWLEHTRRPAGAVSRVVGQGIDNCVDEESCVAGNMPEGSVTAGLYRLPAAATP